MEKLTTTLAALLLLPGMIGAQELPPERGLVLDEGEWRAPTPVTALRALVNREGQWPMAPAVALLRQTFEQRSDAELRVFTDELTRIMLEGSDEAAKEAELVLLTAANSEYPEDGGTPYTGAAAAFIQVYETHGDRTSDEAWNTLARISWTGGVDYIAQVFETAEVPPRCQPHATPEIPGEDPCRPRSVWCSAGLLLFDTVYAPNEEEYDSRCERNW